MGLAAAATSNTLLQALGRQRADLGSAKARSALGLEYDPLTDRLVSVLTRFDPSTKTRVPVTQQWVDEAVAEIVRLNVEIGAANRGVDPGVIERDPMSEVDMLKVDRIWEAVRAASAV